ncbi:MAG: hypothetical protein CHACPFDD_02976 [Phycisphaerae bacterium]|nr:hypothetical protein [Phycisphaerae bacterium]
MLRVAVSCSLTALFAAVASGQTQGTKGEWGDVFTPPHQSIHLVRMKDGRVLSIESTYDYKADTPFRVAQDTVVIDPAHANYPDNVTVYNEDGWEMNQIVAGDGDARDGPATALPTQRPSAGHPRSGRASAGQIAAPTPSHGRAPCGGTIHWARSAALCGRPVRPDFWPPKPRAYV